LDLILWKIGHFEEPFVELVGPIPTSKLREAQHAGRENGERKTVQKVKRVRGKQMPINFAVCPFSFAF
jgi:hypothetical protein